jgi:hypothetical protein
MGLRVERYGLEELHRIALPGTSAPTLFWALPVGLWSSRDVETLWMRFTVGRGACARFGLLIVKNAPVSTDARVDLTSVGARITDLIPHGAVRFVTSSGSLQDRQRLLFLSGAYPQPGWGLLVEGDFNAEHTDALVSDVITRLQERNVPVDQLTIFQDAAAAYHHHGHVRASEPRGDDDDKLRPRITAGKELIHRLTIREGKAGLFGPRELEGLVTALGLSCTPDFVASLVAKQRLLISVQAIIGVSSETWQRIESLVATVASDTSKATEAFRSLKAPQDKQALRGSLFLIHNHMVKDASGIRPWAQSEVTSLVGDVASMTSTLKAQANAEFEASLGQEVLLKKSTETAVRDWRERLRKSREAFIAAADKAAQAQWSIGPYFLNELEHECRRQNLWARSIPWDPARMVGWKLLANDVHLDVLDLQTATRDIIGDNSIVETSQPSDTSVDGSYFTDYVHFVATSQPHLSPRLVTTKFLANLLRPKELAGLARKLDLAPPDLSDRNALAENLLSALGWKIEVQMRETPMAACIIRGDRAQLNTVPEISGNELRIVAESFSKDVLKAIVCKLGYSEGTVFETVAERAPEYQPSYETWDEQVEKLTLGAAQILIRALGSLAFPDQHEEVDRFAVTLQTLGKALNILSHHRETSTPSPTGPEVAKLLDNLLRLAHDLLGECPWHLTPMVVYGDQPKVLSGEAWSHTSSTPRLIRVILWSGETTSNSSVLVWNRNRSNPVITDPVFITRTRRR